MPRKDIREFYKKDVKELSSKEFEVCCMKILRGYAEEESLKDFCIKHNVIVKTHDGKYQIDVYAEYSVFGGSKVKTLVECKQYNNPVKRENVELLNGRVQSTGSNKGILMTTTHFQEGAIRYAEEHGICLIEVGNTCDKFYSYAGSSDDLKNTSFENEIILRYPFFYANTVTSETKQIYPTASMLKKIMKEIQSERS